MNPRIRRPWESLLRGLIVAGTHALTLLPLVVTASLVYPAVTGKALVLRVMVVLLTAAWIVVAITVPRYRPRWSPILATVLVWLAVVGLADVRGVDPYRSLWGTAQRMGGFVSLLHLLALLVVVGSTLRAGREWRRLLTLSVVVSTGISGLAVVEFLFHQAVGNGGHRAEVTFGNPSYLASYLLLHLFLTAYLIAAHAWSRRANVLLGLAFTVQGAALLASGTRGALFGAAVGLVASLGLIAFTRLGRLERAVAATLSLLLAAALVAGAVVQLQSRLPARGGSGDSVAPRSGSPPAPGVVLAEGRSVAQLERLLGQPGRLDDGLNSRLVAWSVALASICERPWSGWGQETFEIATERHFDPRLELGKVFDRPHNAVLGWAVSAGVPGVLAYLAVFGGALLAVWDLGARRNGIAACWLTGLLLGYGVANLFLFDTVTSYLVLTLVLGCLHAEWIAARPRPAGVGHTRLAAASVIPLLLGGLVLVAVIDVPGYRALRLWRQADPMGDLSWRERVTAMDEALALGTFADEEIRRAYLELCSAAFGRRTPEQIRQQCFDQAVAAMKELVQRGPQRLRHLEDLGRFLLSTGHPSEGLRYLEMALDRVPRKPGVRLQIARALEATGRHDAALSMARAAYELEPRQHWSRVFYSGLAYSQGHIDLAVALLAPRASEEVPEATVSSLLPAELGGDSSPEDRRWLAALLDFDARRNSAGGTWGTLRQLVEDLPGIPHGVEMSQAARRVDETVRQRLRARTNAAP